MADASSRGRAVPTRSGQTPRQTGTGRVRTKRVQDPPAPEDGTRVLIMRLWPRGIRRSAVDLWLKGLGTPLDLVRQWKGGTASWGTVARGYRRHLTSDEGRGDLERLVGLARRGRVTLLCTCPEEARCHRGTVKQVLLERLGSHREGRGR